MKHIKLYEDFSDEEIGGTDSFILTNGKILHFWEEEQEGMAGESMYIWKFRIDGEKEDVFYKDIKHLLKSFDKMEMEKLMKKSEEENADVAKSHVR